MKFKRKICVLFSLVTILSSCLNVSAGIKTLNPHIEPTIYTKKNNWCWVTSGMYMIKHFVPSIADNATKEFIKLCDPNAVQNFTEYFDKSDVRQNVFRHLWAIREYLKNNYGMNNFNIEHYIYSEKYETWAHKKISPNAEYRAKPGTGVSEALYKEESFDFETFKNLIKNQIDHNTPIIASVDTQLLENWRIPNCKRYVFLKCRTEFRKQISPAFHSIIIKGYKTDDNTGEITHVMIENLYSTKMYTSDIKEIPIKDFFEICGGLHYISENSEN